MNISAFINNLKIFCHNGKHHHSAAFTLAEVLITLGIIGIVAEMTIPTLMNNVQDQTFKTGWKKAFSELSQAQQEIITDNGGVDFVNQCADFDDKCLRGLFMAKMNIVKSCDDPITDGCQLTSTFMDGTVTSPLTTGINLGWPAIITSSGYSVKFRSHYGDCHDYAAWNIGYPVECGWMQVDVNGIKKPNMAGKDIFFLGISKNKLVARGIQGDTITSADCAAGGSGAGCSALYLYK